MSHELLEELVASELAKQGFTIKKNARIGKWEADLVIQTPSKGKVLVEIKNRTLGIPDVLSVASMANNMSSSFSIASGSIVTTNVPAEPVMQAAINNNVAVWIVREPSDLLEKASFTGRAIELEMRLRKMVELRLNEKVAGFNTMAEGLRTAHVIDGASYDDLVSVYETRNRMTHGREITKAELDAANSKSINLLERLQCEG